MRAKKLLLAILSLSTLIGLVAVAGRYGSRRHKPGAGDAAPLSGATPPFAEEYRRIMERYNNVDSFLDLSGIIRIYDGGNKFSLQEQRTFRYTRSGRQFYARLSRLQTFCDGNLILQLDTLTRSIVLSAAPEILAKNANPGATPFEAMFADTARFRISGTVAAHQGGRTLRVESEYNPGMRSFSIDYDTATYRLQRAEGDWWKRAPLDGNNTDDNIWRARIEYSYGKPVAIDMRAKINAIVSVSGGKVTVNPLYKDYQLNTRLNDR